MSKTEETALCQLCGEPMPEGEKMFNYHGMSGTCPAKKAENKIASTVKYLRQRRKWSLDECAKQTGLSKSYIWEIENGKDRRPSYETMCKFADAFAVSLNLFRGIDDDYLAGYQAAQGDALAAIRGIGT